MCGKYGSFRLVSSRCCVNDRHAEQMKTPYLPYIRVLCVTYFLFIVLLFSISTYFCIFVPLWKENTSRARARALLILFFLFFLCSLKSLIHDQLLVIFVSLARVKYSNVPIAEGGFSFVYPARNASTGEIYALKKILCQVGGWGLHVLCGTTYD